jgi:hypothetical protein
MLVRIATEERVDYQVKLKCRLGDNLESSLLPLRHRQDIFQFMKQE